MGMRKDNPGPKWRELEVQDEGHPFLS